MGQIGKYQQVCCSTLNWGPLKHASCGAQLRVMQHVLRVCQLIKLQAVYTHIVTVGSFNFVCFAITYSPCK